MQELKEKLKPFFWCEVEKARHETVYSMTLYADQDYLLELFALRAEEGFQGNGYDWSSLAEVFLEEKMPELQEYIRLDSEAGMFSAYSQDRHAIEQFALGFKKACEDDALIRDLFSRAELD